MTFLPIPPTAVRHLNDRIGHERPPPIDLHLIFDKSGLSALNIHPRPVLPQPFLALAILGQHLVDFVPKRIGMVEMVKVTEFMDDDVDRFLPEIEHIDGSLMSALTFAPALLISSEIVLVALLLDHAQQVTKAPRGPR